VEGETHEHGLWGWSIPRTNMDRLDESIARQPNYRPPAAPGLTVTFT
jgi:hypothetical protein